MNIFEQLLEKYGYEGFIQVVIDGGVDELRMRRFMDIVTDDNGNILYNAWLMENAERLINEKLGVDYINDDDAIKLSVIMINEFMTWLDDVISIL